MTVDIVLPPSRPLFRSEYYISSHTNVLRRRFPNLKLIQENSIESVMEKLCPELISYSIVAILNNNKIRVLSKRAIKVFGTYLWVMREYHELYDL